MADQIRVHCHFEDSTGIDVTIRHHDDGHAYFVISLGPDLVIFASPEFADRLESAIANSALDRVPTEAEAMFIGMVEKELDEEGSCP